MKRGLAFLMLCILLLSGCARRADDKDETRGDKPLTVAAVAYPVALLAEAVTAGVDGVAVTAVINQSVSCLHDYTLTTTDMRVIEGADILLLSGAGLEAFMGDVLAGYRGRTVDCSAGVSLLSHGEEADPHIWMDPARAAVMARNIADALAEHAPAHAEAFLANASAAEEALVEQAAALRERAAAACPYLITFHDGFAYFADALGLTILRAIEEEAGSAASARDMRELVALIHEYDLPAVYTEENGADATARAIARETGVFVSTLSMLMSGEAGAGLSGYLAAMERNVAALALPRGASA